jgi:hypothetical protein
MTSHCQNHWVWTTFDRKYHMLMALSLLCSQPLLPLQAPPLMHVPQIPQPNISNLPGPKNDSFPSFLHSFLIAQATELGVILDFLSLSLSLSLIPMLNSPSVLVALPWGYVQPDHCSPPLPLPPAELPASSPAP